MVYSRPLRASKSTWALLDDHEMSERGRLRVGVSGRTPVRPIVRCRAAGVGTAAGMIMTVNTVSVHSAMREDVYSCHGRWQNGQALVSPPVETEHRYRGSPRRRRSSASRQA